MSIAETTGRLIQEPDVILICVPTPLSDSRDPDLRHVESTARAISQRLRPGQLVILESTTYPGTTRDVIVPILNQSWLRAGVSNAFVSVDYSVLGFDVDVGNAQVPG